MVLRLLRRVSGVRLMPAPFCIIVDTADRAARCLPPTVAGHNISTDAGSMAYFPLLTV
jgi:hypothetical protein